MTKQSRRTVAILVTCLAIIVVPMIVFVATLTQQQKQQRNLASEVTWEHTPPELLGVDPQHYAYAEQAHESYPQAFRAGENQENARKNVRLWLASRSLDLPDKPSGQDFWCGPQEIGDCVGCGFARAVSERLANQKALGKSSFAGQAHPSYHYGIARRTGNQHGFGKLPCNSDGAIPTLAAKNFDEWGFILLSDAAPPYKGSLSSQWGCKGVPAQWTAIGRDRSGGEVYPIRTVEELRDALCNGYPCTFAGPFTPGQRYEADGKPCLRWNGRMQGYHQMCITGYDGSLGEGREYFWIQNSHGPNAQAAVKPVNGEPPGGFWVPWKTMKSMIEDRGELWAISDVAGFPADDIDWSIFDQFKAERRPQLQPPQGNDDAKDNRRAAARSRPCLLVL